MMYKDNNEVYKLLTKREDINYIAGEWTALAELRDRIVAYVFDMRNVLTVEAKALLADTITQGIADLIYSSINLAEKTTKENQNEPIYRNH